MSTTSTKSRAKKKPEPAAEDASGDGLSALKWRIASASILMTGAFLRLYDLGLVPFHHDEGVNGNFLVTLVREGRYQYDPQNYHGPTLYFFSAVIPWIVRFFGGKSAGDTYGLTTFNVRLVTAAFGVATIWLALLLRKRLGAIGALSAAGLMAIAQAEPLLQQGLDRQGEWGGCGGGDLDHLAAAPDQVFQAALMKRFLKSMETSGSVVHQKTVVVLP